MLKEMGLALMEALKDKFIQIEFYEGQFESFDEQVVNPPAAYLDYRRGEEVLRSDPLSRVEISLYMMSSSVARSGSPMLEILEGVIEAANQKALHYDGVYLGRCFYDGFRNYGTYPGLVVWECLLRVER